MVVSASGGVGAYLAVARCRDFSYGSSELEKHCEAAAGKPGSKNIMEIWGTSLFFLSFWDLSQFTQYPDNFSVTFFKSLAGCKFASFCCVAF